MTIMKNRLHRSFTRTYILFFFIVSLLGALCLFILNEQIVHYFEATGQLTVENMNNKDNLQDQRIFFQLALQTLVIFLFLLALTIYLFSRWTAHRLTIPLNLIATGIRNIAQGHYDQRLQYEATYELAQIQKDFNTMAEQLQQLKREAAQLQEKKQQMLVNLSHDLKTPMTSIQGYLEAMRVGLIQDEEKRTQTLQLLEHKVKIVSSLIQNIFELAQLDSPHLPFSVQQADVAEFLRETVATFYPSFEEKQFQLAVSIPINEVWGTFNEMWLYRAVSNLLTNAMHYNPPGTNVEVKLLIQQDIEIHVIDDGIGIPLAQREAIFEPFVRGDSARKSDGGTGLGLAIAQQVAEKHGGSLRLSSNEKTHFILSLPYNKQSQNNINN